MGPYPINWKPDDHLVRSSLFSYQCGRCCRCCKDKLIQISPYEIAVLAKHLGISTTVFITNYMDGVHLRHQGEGDCIFFNEQGCGVHLTRPVVCRLYPLGREKTPDGEESFVHHPPHPQTEGTYGEVGTVADWLEQQNVGPMIAGRDSYVALFRKLFAEIAKREGDPRGIFEWPDGAKSMTMPDLLDIDAMLMAECPNEILVTIEERVARHQEILRKIFGLNPDKSDP